MEQSSFTENCARLAKINVIIIGAGLSGLASAYYLHQRDPLLRIRIIEALGCAGGQLCCTRLGEIGAKWITEDQYHAMSLLKSLNVTTRRRSILGANFKNCREIDKGFFASLAKYELKRYINELELKADYYKPGYRKRSTKIESMHTHICKRLFFNSSRKFMFNLVSVISGVNASSITFENFMTICYSSGGIKRLIELLITVPNTLLEFSSSELLNNLLENLTDIEIYYNCEAFEIIQFRDHVEVRDTKNTYHLADIAILAIPWNDIQKIYFWPPIPYEIQISPLRPDENRFIMTSFIANYRESYWHNANFSGNFLSSEPFIVGYEYRPTTYCGYMLHEEGIEPLGRSMILDKLAKSFGEQMLLPIDYHQCSYQLPSMAHLPLTTPWNLVIWSSSAAAATCYRGRLSGAVQSGLRAAINGLLVIRPQIVRWQDIEDIQCSKYLKLKHSNCISYWLSTCNLYNVTTYTMITASVLLLLNRFYKRNPL